jgi:hypothetical protein
VALHFATSDGDKELSLLVEVVVLVVLGPLQGQLQRETILGDLIDPNRWATREAPRTRGEHHRDISDTMRH